MESLPHKHRHKSKCLFLRHSALSRPRHPSCSLLQDSGCDNIEKDFRTDFSELQEAQWVSSLKASLVCHLYTVEGLSFLPDICIPTHGGRYYRPLKRNKCWKFSIQILCSQVFLVLSLSLERWTANPLLGFGCSWSALLIWDFRIQNARAANSVLYPVNGLTALGLQGRCFHALIHPSAVRH